MAPQNSFSPVMLTPGHVSLAQLRQIARTSCALQLDPSCHAAIDRAAETVAKIAESGMPAYGINTGFGRLAQTHIPHLGIGH